MSKRQPTVFVLWGHYCEEMAATVFVTTFRAVGLQVKLVGLSGQRNAGEHGLVLIPDITLDAALALVSNASCVVIPCDFACLYRFADDPQFRQFLQRANAHQAWFVVGEAV